MTDEQLIELQNALQATAQACITLQQVLTRIKVPELAGETGLAEPVLHDAHVQAWKRYKQSELDGETELAGAIT